MGSALKSPLKLTVFSPFYPPHIGGLESHAEEFNKHLAKNGISITVFTPRLPQDAEEETNSENIRIVRFPAWEPMHNYPLPKYAPFFLTKKTFSIFLKLLREEKPDIVIARTRFFSTSLFALVYAKWRRIPFLHIEHGSDFVTFNSPLKTFLGKCYDHTFGRVVLSFADAIVANSQASATFVKKLSGKNACVVYRGIETERIIATESHKDILTEKNKKTVIGYIGRLIDGKGVADLLMALAKLDRDDFLCFIVGDGPEREKLEKLAKQPMLDGKIRFFGYRNHNEAVAIMKTFDIFVNPSYGEGMPTAVTEAALAGIAIVATAVGGTPEIISGNGDGFLIPAGQPEIIKEKIEYLLNHPEERKRLGDNAKSEVREKFSWNRTADRYLEVFAKLLENRKK